MYNAKIETNLMTKCFMMQTIEDFYHSVQSKIDSFNNFISTHELKTVAIADHIGYKCSTTEEFETLRKLLESNSHFIFQSIISKRRIAIIELAKPFETSCGLIQYLELSDQKPDGSQTSGFDHLEIYPAQNTVKHLVNYLQDKNITIQKADRPHHVTYDLSLEGGFKVRIEAESLIQKIIREEMRI